MTILDLIGPNRTITKTFKEIMMDNDTNLDESSELDDVLDHAFFSNDEESPDTEDEFVFFDGDSEDFRWLDEL